MKTADFYGEVRRTWGPTFKAAGFRRDIPGSPGLLTKAGMWIKALPEPGPSPAPERLIVAFEHSHHGWSSSWGGAFRLWVEAGPMTGFLELLDDSQVDLVVDMQRRVVSRLPYPLPGAEQAATLLAARRRDAPFVSYFDPDDVREWLELLLPWIPNMAVAGTKDPSIAEHFQPWRT